MSDMIPQLVLGSNVGGHIAGPLYNAAEALIGKAYGSAHTYMERVEGRKVARLNLLNVSVPEWRKTLEKLEAQQPAITARVEALHAELEKIAADTDLRRYARTGQPDRVAAYTSFLSSGINRYRAMIAASQPVDDIPEEVKLAAKLADLKREARKYKGQLNPEHQAEFDTLYKRLEVMSSSVDLTHHMRPVVKDPVDALLEHVAIGISGFRKSSDALKQTSFPDSVVKSVEYIDLGRELERIARTIEKTRGHIESAAKDHIDPASIGEPLFDAEVAFGLSCRLMPIVSIDLPTYSIQAIAAMGIGNNDANLKMMQDSRAGRHEGIRTAANNALSLIVLAESALPDVTTHVKGMITEHGHEDAVAAVLAGLEKKGMTTASIRKVGENIWEQTKTEKSIARSAQTVANQGPGNMYG